MRPYHADEHPYIRQVLHRAQQDATFRELLKQHPHRAIKDETGIDVPPDFKIRFVEPFFGNGLRVMMPEPPPPGRDVVEEERLEEDEELSLDDLEEAAGGTGDPVDPESPW